MDEATQGAILTTIAAVFFLLGWRPLLAWPLYRAFCRWRGRYVYDEIRWAASVRPMFLFIGLLFFLFGMGELSKLTAP